MFESVFTFCPKMACSKTVLDDTTVDFGPLAPQIIDGIMRYHEVGGLYITQREFDTLRAVWEGALTWLQLPCRFTELAARFTALGGSQCQLESTYNLCRLSMGIRSEQMDLLDVCFQEEKRQEGREKIDLFIRWLMKKCTIKEERYILDRCFIVPYCGEHDMCRLFHSMNRRSDRKPIRFCCCANENCNWFCSFDKSKELLNPLAKVMKSTAFLEERASSVRASSCKFCKSEAKKFKFS